MTTFDILFYNVFNYYKSLYKRKANTIALFYISTLQISLLLLSGIIIAVFLEKMHYNSMASEKAWALFLMASVIIYFKNWIQYSGKKRKVLNAKHQSKIPHYHIGLLWVLLLGCILLSIIVFQAL